jgi:hypothetical protein
MHHQMGMPGDASTSLVMRAVFSREDGHSEFGSSARSAWSEFAAERSGFVPLLVLLALAGLAVATAASRSPKLHVLTHVVADVCGLLPVGLMLSSLRDGSTVVPRGGCYLLFVGALAIAVAALVRRGQLSQHD